MMATLRCDHPDIEAFIEAKREPGRLRMFNLSVLVTDAFMAGGQGGRAVGARLRRHDVSKVLPARELWDKIMRATYAYAEPGVIFIDRINRRNNLCYCETITRDQSLRRAAAAALRRVPAGLDQSGAAWSSDPFTPEARLDVDAAATGWCRDRRAHDGQRHRYLADSPARSSRKRRRRSGASGSASPALPMR